MEDGILLEIGDDGTFRKYEEPYCTIECKTEEDFNKFKELVNIGKKVKENIGEFSDGYHTFNELYDHRMVLFAVICGTYKGDAWKSFKHHDGSMYDDYFIVGIDTPEGQYSYHYHINEWMNFDVKELEFAPEWDGHEPKDIGRLFSLLWNA